MPSAASSVIYPQGVKFNMDYYISSHMPMVYKHWSANGLKSWKVIQYSDDQPYAVQAYLEWESDESYKTALTSPAVKDIMEDVKNFSDKAPTFLSGPVVGSS